MSSDNSTSTAGAPAPASEMGVSAGAPPRAYVIPRALAQATLDYLASQPYREVFALVQAFEALEPHGEDAKSQP
jgi:hypothetical protein